jgi:hypothetical protein
MTIEEGIMIDIVSKKEFPRNIKVGVPRTSKPIPNTD